ncbi:MAG TPA: hypothetical protein VH561_16450 [Micromonosporaceae bacterium]
MTDNPTAFDDAERHLAAEQTKTAEALARLAKHEHDMGFEHEAVDDMNAAAALQARAHVHVEHVDEDLGHNVVDQTPGTDNGSRRGRGVNPAKWSPSPKA